jgi:hypothetical protein
MGRRRRSKTTTTHKSRLILSPNTLPFPSKDLLEKWFVGAGALRKAAKSTDDQPLHFFDIHLDFWRQEWRR